MDDPLRLQRSAELRQRQTPAVVNRGRRPRITTPFRSEPCSSLLERSSGLAIPTGYPERSSQVQGCEKVESPGRDGRLLQNLLCQLQAGDRLAAGALGTGNSGADLKAKRSIESEFRLLGQNIESLVDKCF